MSQASRKPATFSFFLYDNRARQFIRIDDGCVIGRTDGEVRFPKDKLVSMRHCRFQLVGNEVYIEDFGSTNKTKVNSVPIEPNRRRRIRLNDVIEVGAQMFVLTNQNKEKPGNTHDAHHKEQPYKAVVGDDGSLEPYATSATTKRTLVDINWIDYQLMKLKRAGKVAAGPKRVSKAWSIASLLAIVALGVLSLLGYSLKDLASFVWRLW